jgi:hypothetical protein
VKTALKVADLGHTAKPLDIHLQWTNRVLDEFFRQGDMEKARGVPVSMYCDRLTTNIPKSQAGFITNICLPLFEEWTEYCESDTIGKHLLHNARGNLRHWIAKSNEGVHSVRPSPMPSSFIIPDSDLVEVDLK